jgi:hypothetical protein
VNIYNEERDLIDQVAKQTRINRRLNGCTTHLRFFGRESCSMQICTRTIVISSIRAARNKGEPGKLPYYGPTESNMAPLPVRQMVKNTGHQHPTEKSLTICTLDVFVKWRLGYHLADACPEPPTEPIRDGTVHSRCVGLSHKLRHSHKQ